MGGPPDLILLAGTVITLRPAHPRAEAVAVRGGLVVAAGSRQEVLGLAGPETQVVDRPGLCVVPGFHDSHLHLAACAGRQWAVDCSPSRVQTLGQLQDALREQARRLPKGHWIRAGNYDEFRLAERRHPTRQELDIATEDHPVKLVHRSLHACVLNSAALRAAGLWKGNPGGGGLGVEASTGGASGPAKTLGVNWPGARECRGAPVWAPSVLAASLGGHTGPPLQSTASKVLLDLEPATGEPTGLVFEYGGDAASTNSLTVEEAELRLSLDRVLLDLVAAGVTSVQDASAGNGPREWERFREVCSQPGPRPRLGFMVGSAHLDQFVEAGMGPGFGDEWLKVGAVKMMLTEEGDSFHPPAEELAGQVRRAADLGFQVAIHAVEESAICVAAEALAAAPLHSGRLSHRIEHCSVLPPPLLDRLAELRLSVATQPAFLYHSGDRYLSQVESHLHGWLYPLRSMLEKGLEVGGGSDAPVDPFNPLEGIRAAVTRQTREGQRLGESERLSVEQALRLYTSGAAAVSGEGHRKGTIEPGKLADLAVLSADPTTMHPQDLGHLQVEMTILGGEIAWERS